MRDNSNEHAYLLKVLEREKVIKLSLDKKDDDILLRIWTNKKTKTDAFSIAKCLQNLEF